MKLPEVNFRNMIAAFVVVFGMGAIVFVRLSDLVIGLLSGYVLAVVQFLFGSSKGSEAKDKMIQEMTFTAPEEGDPIPQKGPKG